jgi:hypothetical protein
VEPPTWCSCTCMNVVEFGRGFRQAPLSWAVASVRVVGWDVVGELGTIEGHAFISYFREDSESADRVHRVLEAAGVRVWRDTSDLWGGEDWRDKIRRAIVDDALVFISCFSRRGIARKTSYQNAELALAIEQLQMRSPEWPWLIPVRFDDCDIPDLDIGRGRTLRSLQRVDVFGDRSDEGTVRLVTAVLRICKYSEFL